MPNRQKRFGMHKDLGSNWLLLRGLAREAGHWGDFLPLMREVFPDARINTLDLPGTGLYHRENSPALISAIMEWLRQQAREQGLLDQPLTILALSMGGMVAWEWLIKHPAEIQGAVLVNSSFANLSAFHQRMRWQSYRQFLQILLEKDLYQREQAILALVSNSPDRYAVLAESWYQIQQQRPVSFKNFIRQITAAAQYKPSRQGPKQPVLLLNSQGDRLVSPSCTQRIAENWQLEVKTHPWAGHDLSIDDGVWLGNQLKNWIVP